jgi:hypothetical protein
MFTVYLDYMCARSMDFYSVSRLCVLGAYIFTVYLDYVCARSIYFVSIFKIFQLDFLTNLMVRYFLFDFFILFV